MSGELPLESKEDPTRIGESVMTVLDPGGPSKQSGLTFEDYETVWSKVLKLAGHEAPPGVLGWIPVFAAKSRSPEDVARAKEINTFIAEIASLENLSFIEDNDYWKVVDEMWGRIQKEKKTHKGPA